MTNSLIWNPEIFVVGQTRWNEDELDAWMTFNEEDILKTMDTPNDDAPIQRLWRDVNEADSIDRMIEFAGRHCYRAWGKGRDRKTYIRNIIDMQHGSVLEHATFNMALQGVSRSLSLELVRHRVGVAISQESQRYVDAMDINFVIPPMLGHICGGANIYVDENTGHPGVHPYLKDFLRNNMAALESYDAMQTMIVDELGSKQSGITKKDTMAKKRANEAARALLPNDCETRLMWTANVRLLRHFFFLRGGVGADLEIRRLAVAMLEKLQSRTSAFDDMAVTYKMENTYGVGVIVQAA